MAGTDITTVLKTMSLPERIACLIAYAKLHQQSKAEWERLKRCYNRKPK